MSRYYDDDGDYDRGRGRRSSPPPQFRDRSPDYHYAGGASQARLQYEPQSPFYPPDGGNNLQVPQSRHRPRSLPPMSSGAIVPRGRRPHSPASSVSSEDRDRDRSPMAKARHVLKDTFSQSNSGLGVGVLGAIVGGIAAREASEATIRARGKGHSGDHEKSRLVSTIIGAAVGLIRTRITKPVLIYLTRWADLARTPSKSGWRRPRRRTK